MPKILRCTCTNYTTRTMGASIPPNGNDANFPSPSLPPPSPFPPLPFPSPCLFPSLPSPGVWGRAPSGGGPGVSPSEKMEIEIGFGAFWPVNRRIGYGSI